MAVLLTGAFMALLDTTIDSFHSAGNLASVGTTLAILAVWFERFERPDVAATLYGASTYHPGSQYYVNLPAMVDHLRAVLGDAGFDQCAATGAAMDLADAVGYARHHIELARCQVANPNSGRT